MNERDASIPQDLDDTARLVLMDQPNLTAVELRRALREHGVCATVDQMIALGRRYLGWRGEFATHNVETGKRYTWGN